MAGQAARLMRRWSLGQAAGPGLRDCGDPRGNWCSASWTVRLRSSARVARRSTTRRIAVLAGDWTRLWCKACFLAMPAASPRQPVPVVPGCGPSRAYTAPVRARPSRCRESRRPRVSGPAVAAPAPACRAGRYPAACCRRLCGAPPSRPEARTDGSGQRTCRFERRQPPAPPPGATSPPPRATLAGNRRTWPATSAAYHHASAGLPAGLALCDGIRMGDSGPAPGARR